MKKIVVIVVLGVAVWMFKALAQEGGEDGGAGAPGDHDGKRPMPPIEAALDANGDGVIDAEEIASASTSLKKLDKNGDGKLTADEYRPPMPPKRSAR